MQAGQQRQNQFGMRNAFMPEGYMNDNYSMRQAGNPYFIPEPQDLYVTMAPDYWNQSNPMTWQDYTTQMQEDYGAFSPPEEAAAPKPAAPSTTMDYSKWLNGSIWDQEISHRYIGAKQTLGALADGGSSGGWTGMHGWGDAAKYAPPKPGEGATNQDWIAYNTAKNMWDDRISAGKTRYDSIMQGN